MKGRVVVGLSGGVDSSVAAYLLQQEGYEVIGMFMKNWHDASVLTSDECPWVDDSQDALQVAEALGIPFQTIDFSEPYRKRIVDYMFAEYERGRTPNPDVLCNREIKFDVFLEAALQLGADFVATGHYCRKETIEVDGNVRHRLLAGADPSKDQSYFLCQVRQEQLARALFPIGHLQKSEVRELARSIGLVTAEKKDSQGLCFVGKVRLPDFLQQQLKPKPGPVVRVEADAPLFAPVGSDAPEALAEPYTYATDAGTVIGEHPGAHFFTIGQRKGLGVGGGTAEPLFVLATDTQSNTVYAGEGEDHPGLYRPGLFIPWPDVHWVRPDLALKPGDSGTFQVRIRYRQALQQATLIAREAGIYLVFEEPQRGITPGQFAAWYRNEELIGSGVIA